MAQCHRARYRSRRQALHDNCRFLGCAPPWRSRQHLNAPETVPVNGQITWQTSLDKTRQDHPFVLSPARRDRAPLTDQTSDPGSSVSATICRFNAAGQRRRRLPDIRSAEVPTKSEMDTSLLYPYSYPHHHPTHRSGRGAFQQALTLKLVSGRAPRYSPVTILTSIRTARHVIAASGAASEMTSTVARPWFTGLLMGGPSRIP
jgi:hypothetical protein